MTWIQMKNNKKIKRNRKNKKNKKNRKNYKFNNSLNEKCHNKNKVVIMDVFSKQNINEVKMNNNRKTMV